MKTPKQSQTAGLAKVLSDALALAREKGESISVYVRKGVHKTLLSSEPAPDDFRFLTKIDP